MYLTNPCGSGLSGWDDILQQVAQAGADYVTHEATGVPTYGGAPAYQTNAGTYSPAPPPVVLETRPALPGWVLPAGIAAAAIGGAKLFGLF